MKSGKPDRQYYHKLFRQCSRFCVDLPKQQWCDFWHTHFDWEGFGNLSWTHRRRHLTALLRALSRARAELSSTNAEYQLFAMVFPDSSADDAIFVHTSNPNGTTFPCVFNGATSIDKLPPLLAGYINLNPYSVMKQNNNNQVSYIIQARR